MNDSIIFHQGACVHDVVAVQMGALDIRHGHRPVNLALKDLWCWVAVGSDAVQINGGMTISDATRKNWVTTQKGPDRLCSGIHQVRWWRAGGGGGVF